jgi:hypothetical protein
MQGFLAVFFEQRNRSIAPLVQRDVMAGIRLILMFPWDELHQIAGTARVHFDFRSQVWTAHRITKDPLLPVRLANRRGISALLQNFKFQFKFF